MNVLTPLYPIRLRKYTVGLHKSFWSVVLFIFQIAQYAKFVAISTTASGCNSVSMCGSFCDLSCLCVHLTSGNFPRLKNNCFRVF